ncbi:phosphoadenosine phosphosulfate reductase family protein [Bacillus alkalicellulosilyticus]|uniref:phosphoadenosine phosphosulfate reductase domain-containing protein n=1 Tax=Alkalihalobacterium alkalicellulosilyticum TaxID=1912214 RepID=UPI000997D404|nr:phosphoadenosine phosphosulfate reductase family protein [Bacillus alkalicellulosilyticus]
MKTKLELFVEKLIKSKPENLNFGDYDNGTIHLNFSGGKDSVALSLIMLYGYKIPRHKLQLVHMRIDGKKSNKSFFDYPETDQYLEYAANKLGLPLTIISGELGLKERIKERGKFPSSTTQFCTSYGKRDVYSKWVRGQGPGNYLCVTGERAEESWRRRNRPIFEVYKPATAPTKNRFVYSFRPIHHLFEEEVWELMRLADIEPHPCYTEYKVSRCSCKFCIFLSPEEMKRNAEAFPEQFNELIEMEKSLNHTMKFEKGEQISLSDFIKKERRKKPDQMKLDLFTPPCAL